MKRTLFLSVLFGMLLTTAHAENESHQQVESTLYAYYRWCNNNIRDTAVLSKADTLFRLSGEKHDIRMQAVALSLKADHYYFNNNLDSLKAWIPRVQDFARKNDQIKYYYFTWSRLILYYTKQAQYTLAQYELEQYMSQAEKDNYKPATAEAYKQLGHIYRTRGLKKPAVEYYRKAIDFIIQNGLNTFHLSNLYSDLATTLSRSRRSRRKRQGMHSATGLHLGSEGQGNAPARPDRPDRQSQSTFQRDQGRAERQPLGDQTR